VKAQLNNTHIARLFGPDKFSIIRELRRNAGCRGCRAKQGCELAFKRSEWIRKARARASWAKEQASALLRLQWRPEHVAARSQSGPTVAPSPT